MSTQRLPFAVYSRRAGGGEVGDRGMNPAATHLGALTPALARAIARWRTHAWLVVHDPAATDSQRRLAWRFLKQHGVA